MMTIDEQNEAATLTKTHKRRNQSILNNFPLVLYTFGVLKVHNTTKYSILNIQVSLFKV